MYDKTGSDRGGGVMRRVKELMRDEGLEGEIPHLILNLIQCT